jgi:hypothetical protein
MFTKYTVRINQITPECIRIYYDNVEKEELTLELYSKNCQDIENTGSMNIIISKSMISKLENIKQS